MSVTKNYINTKHSTDNLSTLQGSSEKNEESDDRKLPDKRRKKQSKCKIADMVQTADQKKCSFQGDTTNWN